VKAEYQITIRIPWAIRWFDCFLRSPITMILLTKWLWNAYSVQIGERSYRVIPVRHIVLTDQDFRP
jgi:hypothetical protein